LEDCIAYFEGKVVERFSPGNHTLFFAEVVDARVIARDQQLSSQDYDGVYLGRS
jgi:flavin reductase (DIM6/NTAB) family NADH-FMN oxidoreductase RutF